MSEPVLLEERDGPVATLTLNRPGAMNALSRELRGALADAFARLDADDACAVVILTGAGRAFCAGLDLKELGREETAPAGQTAGGSDPVRAMESCTKPIVGAVNGHAITGGFELALACDVLIGSTAARFADTHARVGILPGWGLSQKLPRLVGPQRAKWLSLTGNFLDAAGAERLGLLAEVVAPEELLARARALAADVLSCDPESVRGYKRLIDEGLALPYGEARRLERRASSEHARRVRGADIAGRREAIQSRGRSQTGSGSSS